MSRISILALATVPFLAAAAPALAHEILHAAHEGHVHAKSCGHQAIEHEGHVDYLHDGHLHHAHGGHVDEHAIAVSDANPDAEELVKRVSGEPHPHGHPGEEHIMVQHGDHMDFVHDGHLHHQHGDHTDDHGAVKLVTA